MITVVTPPVGEPCSPTELKARLRVTHDAEDGLMADLLRAARERLEAELGACLLATGLRETVEAPGPAVSLSVSPVLGVDAVARGDGAGGWTALAPAAWRVQGERPALLFPPFASGPLRIDYRAGFADQPDALPPGLKEAVLALAADAYERRTDASALAPPGLGPAERWAAPFRRVRL